jgi:hypothetical protein
MPDTGRDADLRIRIPAHWKAARRQLDSRTTLPPHGEHQLVRVLAAAGGLQLLDGVPAVISTSYYPLWVADGTRLESGVALPEGPDNLIEQLGHRFARSMELLRARMPTPG